MGFTRLGVIDQLAHDRRRGDDERSLRQLLA